MAAGIPERDVHSGPEMLFQLLPSLWVCHPLFRCTAAHFMLWQERLLFFPLCSLISAVAECSSQRGDSHQQGALQGRM